MTALLTSSRIDTARGCQREHLIRYVQGYRPIIEDDALRFGTLVHIGLEAWWLDTKGDRLAAAMDALRQSGEKDPFEAVKAEEMLRGYHYRWEGEQFEVLAVEAQFECPLRNPQTGAASRTWRLGGKIDAVVRCLRTARVLIVEHKTSSEDIAPGSKYWRRLRMDGQVSTYYEGATALGYDVAGCLYDVLGKPSIKPLKATPVESRKYLKKTGELYANQREEDETPEEYRARLVEDIAKDPGGYFQRGEVVRLETEMAEALHDIWQTAQQIREAELAQRYPRNPKACVRYGRECPYFDVCTGVASLDDPLMFKRSTQVHPELSGETAAQPKEEAATV